MHHRHNARRPNPPASSSVVEVVRRDDGHWYRNTLGHLIGPYSTHKRALGEGAMALARVLHPSAPSSEIARIAKDLLAEDRSRPFVRRFSDGWRVWNPRTESFVGHGPGRPFATAGEAEYRRRALAGEPADDGPMFRRAEPAEAPSRAAPQLDLFGPRRNPWKKEGEGRDVSWRWIMSPKQRARLTRLAQESFGQGTDAWHTFVLEYVAEVTNDSPGKGYAGQYRLGRPRTKGGPWEFFLAGMERPFVVAQQPGVAFNQLERHEDLRVLSVEAEEFRRMVYGSMPRANPSDLAVPERVRARLRDGLRLVAEGRAGKGLRGKTVREAENMAHGDPVPVNKVRRMVAWFRRHVFDKRPGWDQRKTPGYVAWLLWGGDEGWAWAERERAALVRKGVLPPLPPPKTRGNPGIFSPLRNAHGEIVSYRPEGDAVVVRFSTPGVGSTDREMDREGAQAHRAKLLRMGYRPNP